MPRTPSITIGARAATIAALAFAGCGGSSGGDVTPFVGVYATTAHTQAQGAGGTIACTDPGQPVTPAQPFFKLAVDPFFMDPGLLLVSNCADPAGASCTDTVVDLRAGGPGLENEAANTQTGGGVMCQLYYSHEQATLTAGTIQIDALDKFDAPAVSSADCTLDKAQALASSPSCQSAEHWTGTKQ